MKIENKEVLGKFRDFISSITEEDNVCVLHDTDMDGMSSGVLLKKGLLELGIEPKLVVPLYHGEKSITPRFIQQLQDNDITVLICADLPVESYPGVEMLEGIRILVLDHHPIERENTMQGLVVIKPIMYETEIDPSQICAANMVYNFFNELTDMSAYAWIAALGIISDSTYQTEKQFVDDVIIAQGDKPKEDVFETDFSRAASYGTYADSANTDTSYQDVFEALDEAENYKDVIKGLKKYAPVEKEINMIIDGFEKRKEVVDNVIFYEFTAKYRINSIVSNIISHKKVPTETLVIVEHLRNMVKISARRQDLKLHMGEMLHDCIQGLEDANGGGHRPAGGAKVKKKDYETFKKRVVGWCRKNG